MINSNKNNYTQLVLNSLQKNGIVDKSEKVTLIVVTHSLSLAERMGQVMELSDGLLKNRSRQ